LRNNHQTSEIPVVFMTARAQAREVEQLISMGAQGVISQAIRPDDARLRGARPSPGVETDPNMRSIGLWLVKLPPSWASPIIASAVIFSAIAWMTVRSESMPERRLDGFNVIATAADPFGSAAATLALTKAKGVGASAVAVIPFLWQPNAASPDLVRGSDMNDDELRAAIREAHALGLAVLVKPHVWVPRSWAGAVAMRSQSDWQQWFANYQREITHIARERESRSAGDRHRAVAIHLVAAMERPDRQNACSFFGPPALCGAQRRGSGDSAVLGSARRHRRFALSAARQRRRP